MYSWGFYDPCHSTYARLIHFNDMISSCSSIISFNSSIFLSSSLSLILSFPSSSSSSLVSVHFPSLLESSHFSFSCFITSSHLCSGAFLPLWLYSEFYKKYSQMLIASTCHYNTYLEGQGDSVSRLITPIIHIVTPFIPIINLVTKSP